MGPREVTRRNALLGLGAVSGAGLVDAFGLEPNWLDVTTHDVPTRHLPRDLDGFKIAQVTDAHLDDLSSVEETILEAIRREDVQVVALTGDIIDSLGGFDVLRQFCSELSGTGAKIVATLGNWEHWGKVPLDLLRLAGHTHGGQVRLSSAVVPFVPPGSGRFVAGWYETSIGRAYVSRGTGTSILPARFTCRPEMPIFRLCQG